METLGTAQYAYAFAVLSAAYFVRGVAGFGSGLIAIPLLLMWFPLLVAVPLVVALDYLASASQGIRDRQAICWAEIWPILPFAVLGVAAALYLLQTVDTRLLLKALAVFIIFYAMYTLSGKTPEGAHSRWFDVLETRRIPSLSANTGRRSLSDTWLKSSSLERMVPIPLVPSTSNAAFDFPDSPTKKLPNSK